MPVRDVVKALTRTITANQYNGLQIHDLTETVDTLSDGDTLERWLNLKERNALLWIGIDEIQVMEEGERNRDHVMVKAEVCCATTIEAPPSSKAQTFVNLYEWLRKTIRRDPTLGGRATYARLTEASNENVPETSAVMLMSTVEIEYFT